jgi:transcriptional regulator with XRE-family HTH domain
MDAASHIARARRAAGLTQPQLAARAATSQAALSAYENGHKDPGFATLARILAAAGAQLELATAPAPVLAPTAAQLERNAETFVRVIELAAALPTRHAPTLRYPRLAS